MILNPTHFPITQTADPLLQMTMRAQYIDIANNYTISESMPTSSSAANKKDKKLERRGLRVNLVYELLKLLYRLPAVNRYTLCYLIHHLRRVAASSLHTFMSQADLSRIFAPLLFGTARYVCSLLSYCRKPYN